MTQCLNVDVSSFGEAPEGAVANLKEAVELYLEVSKADFLTVEEVSIGEDVVHA